MNKNSYNDMINEIEILRSQND